MRKLKTNCIQGIIISIWVSACNAPSSPSLAEKKETSPSGKAEAKTPEAPSPSGEVSSAIESPDEPEINFETESETGSDTGAESDSVSGTEANDLPVYYVHPLGDDRNPGTAEAPFQSIRYAISQARVLTESTEIRVAAGTYPMNYSAGQYIALYSKITLKGGYSASNWNSRDIVRTPSIIVDNGNSGGHSSQPASPVRGMYEGGTIDGFEIRGGGAQDSAGIVLVQFDGVIRNCVINGGSGRTSYGIFSSVSSPVILGNTVNAGDATSSSAGIFLQGNHPDPSKQTRIEQNSIVGGKALHSNRGLKIDALAKGVVAQNRIAGGEGRNSGGITITSANPTIRKNTIFGGTSERYAYGIEMIYSYVTAPAQIEDNTINGGVSDITAGIYMSGAADGIILINKNRIDGGSAQTVGRGILTYDTPVQILENSVFGGTSAGSVFGVTLESAHAAQRIAGNSIESGTSLSANIGEVSIGLQIGGEGNAEIEGNQLTTTAGPRTYCMKVVRDDALPVFRDNELTHCGTADVFANWQPCVVNTGAFSYVTSECGIDEFTRLQAHYR